MSLRERELIIEYIRAVRDQRILLERLSSYIDSANLRLTNVVLAHIMADREESPISSGETESATTTQHNVPRNRRRASFISPPITIPPLAHPPPPPPPPPTPPAQSLTEENTTSLTNISSLSDITVNMDSDPTLARIRRWADRISPRNVMPRARSNAVSSPTREMNYDTSLDSSSNIITRPINSPTNMENITNLTSRYNGPPGLTTILPNRNRIISDRRPIPRRIPHYSRRYSTMMNIPNIVDDSIPEDLGSPVRIRPQNSQVRNSTELLKWEDISGNYQERCPIDFNEFAEGDDILRIKACRHIFREMNLRQWFHRSPRCPICRYDIRDYDGE